MSPVSGTRVDHLGPQGGDAAAGTLLDLSSCVNPYGPAPAALAVLRDLAPEVLRDHPYRAAAALEDLYRRRLAQPEGELVATRGASEAIAHLATALAGRSVALPLPTYTEYLRYFSVDHRIAARGDRSHSVDQLDRAAASADVVVLSNPHNPTGTLLPMGELASLFAQHPRCTFVVDESYADFLALPNECSAVHSGAANVVVIRSPTKFFGLGGVRAGAIWTADPQLAATVRSLRTTWPISMIDVELVRAAFDDMTWADEQRALLHDDAQWLDDVLRSLPDIDVVPAPLHFRLVLDAAEGATADLHAALAHHGIHVRKLEVAHGVGTPALRISAPRASDRPMLAAALA